jgi:hypothetical protein
MRLYGPSIVRTANASSTSTRLSSGRGWCSGPGPYIGPGLPPPKYIPASAVEDAQPSCSAVMHDARQHETPEHVRCADLSLLHDFGPFTSCPAKKLNPELIASRCLRYCAFEFVQSATLWERLKRPRSDGFAVRGGSASRHPASTELLFMYTMGAIDHDQFPEPFIIIPVV